MEKIINELLVTQPLFTHVDLCSKGWISLAPCASCTIFAESGQFQDEITMKTNLQKNPRLWSHLFGKILTISNFSEIFYDFSFLLVFSADYYALRLYANTNWYIYLCIYMSEYVYTSGNGIIMTWNNKVITKSSVMIPFSSGNRNMNLYEPWVFMWFIRLPTVMKVLSHKEHLYGLSPVWTRMWLLRWVCVLNAFVQTEHLYGRSPVWTRICVARTAGDLNPLEHTPHTNSLSSECVLRWTLSMCLSKNAKPHTSHNHSFTFECRFRWVTKLLCFVNVLLQKLHLKQLSCFDLRWPWTCAWCLLKLLGPL